MFRNCRIIGRRFRLAHIFFGGKIIETSTFRANPRHDDDDDELLIRRDNVFGSDTEDARRRDFTINGLFYDVETEQVIDHVGGLADLEARLIRTIGDPEIRFREDPVRMLRAIKFAARLEFKIETATYQALIQHRHEILKCAPPRVLEELYRMLRSGAARQSMALLIETGVAGVLSPSLASLLAGPESIPPPQPPSDTIAPTEDSAESAAALPALPAEPADDPEAAAWAAVWAEDALPHSLAKAQPVAAAPATTTEDEWQRDRAQDWPQAHELEEEQARAVQEDQELDAEDEETNRALQEDQELDAEDEEANRALQEDQELDAEDAAAAESSDLSSPDQPPTSIEANRETAWKLLDQLDALAAGDPAAISNALLLATLLHPFVIDELLLSGNRPVDASTAIMVRSQPVVQELRIARRDAERARQILLAQRRLAPSRRRRGRPMALVRRDYFDDSLTLFEISARAAGRDTADAERWRQLKSEGAQENRSGADEGESTKKRRRRRGGRRRRRPEAEHHHAAAPARSGSG